LDWIYVQRTGEIFQVDYKGIKIPGTGGFGYSGALGHVNNPESQNIAFKGPLPQGTYLIGQAFDSQLRGPKAIPLTPSSDTNTYGRNAFLIHGDNSKGNQSASEGCIIQGRAIRDQIINSNDKILRVVR